MALLKCKECKASVSSDAKACPGCGAAPPKSMSRLQVLFVGACLIGIAAAVSQQSNSTPTPAAKSLTADEVAYKAKEAAFEVAEAAKEKERAGFAARSVAAAVMSALRDPDSAKFTYVGVNDAATVACLQYRARNGLGGMNQDIAVIANNKATSKAADWERYSDPLRDMLAAAEAAR